ncbi:bifunctional 3,4-dihydroxy-2-butanone-4-phosphate synthase/GTP cyclohydrolase II [Sporosarcina pasteurii]|uniref:Riboflavin biosynthesis protein RibBA n=1 Tax=Sporosarcina pasteurii TaxID=1474 RepID=A0A380C7X8_SPOPA|nr:bifunctional 3,4-dihydroxy-2-butanone-4-phosphate synthase/GTP cyclohydrolase II [Sporosarcina pasteurii]MDS9473063.1 bifunctional 3,4-dihydroxy-2-butanone-4-phosphate synthase/GTP cyclohydrolase II [Sporosarcina pasteurii]QBQ04569.1 bifunctional 3,4-dihydroxy-2-butanone-4-phosphate synthase/GTP cyclohydrolase II [Sporosarcina pasteurii]SUJ14162.1 Riboflavin biosynthesis protein ribBA [Sporosarcina pasteurii]
MYTTVEKAIEELKKGKAIIVVDDEDRENEGDFLALGKYATPEMINFMASEGKGLICVPIEEEMAAQLQLPLMAAENSDPYRTAFTVSIDHVTTHTGISTFERSATILSMLNPNAKPEEFNRPGHIFPLIAKSGGVLERPGHTEAAVDLAKLSGAEPAGVICEILNPDGTMARGPELKEIAERFDLVILTIEELVNYRQARESLVEHVVDIELSTQFGEFKVFTYVEKLTGQEHLAFVKGEIEMHENVLVRVHSECLTGDIFGSNRCDCGPQLHAALRQIENEGKGILLYLRQEGRGIGLVNKMKAYLLQDEGYDTVEANEKLGFPDDARDYRIGAHILRDLGVTQISLLTNNPRKITGLETNGVQVIERLPIEMPAKEENRRYMETKKTKLGHLIHA